MLISDIHLRDYHQYNKVPNQRLNSFIELADDIVNIGKEQGIDTLLVGGDLVDKNTLSPSELHVLFTMFSKLAKQFRIHSIIGNHDAKSKKSIDKIDTAITLLETIPGISFHHQEILTIGGRTIAFENWMPEYDLSWMKEPTDLYMSHATIDYDNTGIYGMDTSVFDDKFKYGVFGDIHVNSQMGNLISIGNTKQESRSDKYQGGVMVMDLEDLSYQRIPIDPEHKKYLHLITTEDVEEEGWVDKEGEDMTYRVFQQKKVKGEKVLDLKLPKITDIEAKTYAVMKTEGLLKLHEEIKSSSNYTPVDFNFSLNYLNVTNFRSIKYYSLDLSNNYIITGPTGSGKSTLITALFYALIGKKTLKKEIKYGETACQLQVSLNYQGITYVITRGTAKGDFGLMVGDVVQKYGTKAEFEKSVIEYLPFLSYNESFFFNYWDTELLGNLKVDRRYDLLAKYFRLDALSEYNDIAEARYKLNKKQLKLEEESLKSLEVIKVAREEDLKLISDSLKFKDPKLDLESNVESHQKYLEVEEEIKKLDTSIAEASKGLEDLKQSIKTSEELISVMSQKISTEKDMNLDALKLSLETSIENSTSATSLKERISKGESLVETLLSERKLLSLKLETGEKELETLLPTTDYIEVPSEKISRKFELSNSVETLKRDLNFKEFELNSSIKYLNKEVSELEEKLKEAKTKDNSTCSECNQVVSTVERVKSLEIEIAKVKKRLNLKETQKESGFSIYKEQTLETINTSTKELDSLKIEIEDIENKIEESAKNEEKKGEVEKEILSIKSKIKVSEDSETKYSTAIQGMEKELIEEDILTAQDLKTINTRLNYIELVSKESSKLERLNNKLQDQEEGVVEKVAKYISEKEEKEQSLSYYKKLSSEEYISCLNDLNLYSKREDSELVLSSLSTKLASQEELVAKVTKAFKELEYYCLLTSRSGIILKSVLDELTKTFSSPNFKFITAKVQANGKVLTDMSVSYLVGKRWIPYSSLSSGQRTLCDLYYISKIVTGVGIISFDETLRFLDDENLKVAVDIIDSIKKNGLLVSTHSSNLSIDDTVSLKCELQAGNTTEIEISI